MKKILKVKCTAVLMSICFLVLLLMPITGVNAESENNSDSDSNLVTYSIFGDIDNDGTVDSLDYVKLKMYLLGNIGDGAINTLNADLNSDYNINALDYSLLGQFLQGKITTFPGIKYYYDTPDGSYIAVDQNGQFRVTLQEDSSSGCTWTYTVSEQNSLDLVSQQSLIFSPGKGGPDKRIWTFKAPNPGKYTLIFAYSRTGQPEKYMTFNIFVSGTNESIINVKQNETFIISLREGGLAGYQWTYTSSDDSAFQLVSKERYEESPGSMDGMLQTVWTFSAMKSGTYKLVFNCNHIWEPFECEVNVE
jgi:inhibitor of cysteine peptidase